MSSIGESFRRSRPPAPERVGRSLAGRLVDELPGPVRTFPLEDAVTAGLLAAMLAVVAWSVELARWGNAPLILTTVLLAGLAGLIAARLRVHPLVGHLVSIPFAVLVIVWQSSLPAEGSNIVARSINLWERFFIWIGVARDGGISTDVLPFTLLFIAVSWIVAYLAGWMTFRWNNPWPPVMLLGFAILTNLSYRFHQHEHTFFIFAAVSIPLFTHLTTVRRMAAWRRSGAPFPSNLRWLSIRDGLFFGVAAAAVAALVPLTMPRSQVLHNSWEVARSPIDALREPASRLLAGIEGRDRQMLNQFSETLAFQGPIHLAEEPVFWVESPYATMHASRIYQVYTPQGWLTAETETRQVPAGEPAIQEPPYQGREVINQRILPLHNSPAVLSVGHTMTVDRNAHLHVLKRQEFRITVEPGPHDAELPPDVREFAQGLRQGLADAAARDDGPDFIAEWPTTGRRVTGTPAPVQEPEPEPDDASDGQVLDAQTINRVIAETLPDDLSLVARRHDDTGAMVALVVRRPVAGPDDQVALMFDRMALPDIPYAIASSVSTATDEELQAASTEYPSWITDRYLQLPDELPQRVRDLAQQIVDEAGAETPFEKAEAITAYLRSLVYSQEIEGPDHGQDGVDYFLFETVNEPCPSNIPDCDESKAKGYSQYFGSAMTVLLRSQGVPARMIAGYASGAYVPQAEAFLVRDRDRHGWSQAYFPGYGWINLEGTPTVPRLGRGVPPDAVAPGEIPGFPGGGSPIEDEDWFEDDVPGIGIIGDLPRGQTGEGAAEFPTLPVATAAGSLLVIALLLMGVWRWGLRSLPAPERAYVQMCRLATLLGLRPGAYQTPAEYAGQIGWAAPSSAESAMLIASRYQAQIYGRRAASPDETREIGMAWRRVRGALLGYRLRSLLGG